MKQIICTVLILWLAVSSRLYATESIPSAVTNSGFIENPSKELKNRFPMCDAFLKVEWIDNARKIGYASYEVIMKGKKAKFDGERWKQSALVILSNPPAFDIDVSKYMSPQRRDHLFAAIRNGEIARWPATTIKYKGETIQLHTSDVVDLETQNYPLLSDNLLTVCIAYPDEQLAWIIEGKNVKRTYSKSKADDLSSRILESDTHVQPGEESIPKGIEEHAKYVVRRVVVVDNKTYPVNPEIVDEYIGSFWALDINHDGKDDYIGSRSASLIYYSFEDKLYQMRTGNVVHDKSSNPTYIFPPSNRMCNSPSLGSGMLTTDGKSYYLDDQCNLTDLTSPRSK